MAHRRFCWPRCRGWPAASVNGLSTQNANSAAGGSQLSLLCERVAEHTVALRVVLDSAQAARELRPFDHAEALTLLLGPVVLGMLTQSGYFDYQVCARHAVQGFVAANKH